MLVGRRVEDDLRMVLLHDGVDPVRVPNGADEGHQVELRVLPLQLLLDLVRVVFIDVKDDQCPGTGPCDLAAQLAADGAAPAGHHDHFVLQHPQDLVVVDLHLGPAQKVRDLHVTQLGHADFPVEDLVDAGHGLHPAACVLAYI